MPDFKQLVRDRLSLPPMRRMREAKIIEELAGQLSDLYQLALARGMGEEEAVEYALGEIPDWEAFASDILEAERAGGRPAADRMEDSELRMRARGGLWALIADLRLDTRYALRTLRRSPGFLAVVILTLALGIGANTTIFAMLRAVLLRPIPYPEPDRLVTVWTPRLGYQYNPLSAPDWLDYQKTARSFESWGVYQEAALNLSGDEDPVRVAGVRCTPDLMKALGTTAAVGRLFGEEARDRDLPVVILSDRLWRTRYGADAELVGRDILVNRESRTVVGILSEEFRFPGWLSLGGIDAIVPLSVSETAGTRGAYYLKVIGRLRPETSVEKAEEELKGIAASLEEAYPDTNYRRTAEVVPLRDIVLGDSADGLWILLGVVGFVLLIACTNVAGVVMSRYAGRSSEMAVRTAMGAGRRRLLRQMLTECVVLALIGGAVALLVTWSGMGALRRILPGGLPRIDQLHVDASVVFFAIAVTLLAGILFGIMPALITSRIDLRRANQVGVRTMTAGRAHTRFLAVMVVVQFALTFVLANGAALMLQSLWNVTGFRELHEPDRVLIAGYSQERYGREEIIVPDPFLSRLLEQLRSLPGVQSAGASTRLPLQGGWTANILAEGQTYDPDADSPLTYMVCVSPGYFEAMGITLLQGRALLPEDVYEEGLGVVVNRSFAQRCWPDQRAVGKWIQGGYTGTPWFKAVVVGVVEDVRQNGLESQSEGEVYLPFFPGFQPDRWIALRCEGDPQALVAALRSELGRLDPHLPITQIFTASDLYGFMAVGRRFSTQLIGALALVALCLVAVGTYGAMAYLVRQRSHEMGIRIALGSGRRSVLELVLGRSFRLVLGGIALGLLGAVATARVTASLLFGIGPLAPASLAGTAIFLLLVAMLATGIPALRATRVNPVEAMRVE